MARLVMTMVLVTAFLVMGSIISHAATRVSVENEFIVADGQQLATVLIDWRDHNDLPVVGRAGDIEVSTRKWMDYIYVDGDVVEKGNGIYEAYIKADRPGSTRVLVKLGGEEAETVPVLFARSIAAASGDAPYLGLVEGPKHIETYPGHATIIDNQLTISGIEPEAMMDGARIEIDPDIDDKFKMDRDELGFVIDGVYVESLNSGPVVSSYNDSTGVLTLSGPATVAEYQTVLRRVAYKSKQAGKAQIKVHFVLADLDADRRADFNYDPMEGHYYEYVSERIDILEAEVRAAERSLFGVQGYLATIASDSENDIVAFFTGSNRATIGLSALEEQKVWRWITGPETGTVIVRDRKVVDNHYMKWKKGEIPKAEGSSEGSELWTTINGYQHKDYPRHWVARKNDSTSDVPGYIVEYGGIPGDQGPLLLWDEVALYIESGAPPEFDAQKSTVTVNREWIDADGVDSATIRVELKGSNGLPFIMPSNALLRVFTINHKGDSDEPVERHGNVTDLIHHGSGVYTATITSAYPGSRRIAIDYEASGSSSIGVLLSDQPVIFFRNVSAGTLNVAAAIQLSREYTDVYLTSARSVIVDDELKVQGYTTASSVSVARVEIDADGFEDNQDRLGFIVDGSFTHTNQLFTYGSNTIATTYDIATGVLTLQGEAAAADYEDVLRRVAYTRVSGNDASTRTITFVIGDYDADAREHVTSEYVHDPASGHYYKYISADEITPNELDFPQAELDAGRRSYFGLQGYVVTIMSEAENNLVASEVIPEGDYRAWIGAATQERYTWRWVAGPDTGIVFRIDDEDVPGQYTNWDSNSPSTSNYRSLNMYGASHTANSGRSRGKWDVRSGGSNSAITGYVVEFGGFPGDPEVVNPWDSVVIDIHAPVSAEATKVNFTLSKEWITADGSDSITVMMKFTDSGDQAADPNGDVDVQIRHGTVTRITRLEIGVYEATITSTVAGSSQVIITVDDDEWARGIEDKAVHFRHVPIDVPVLSVSQDHVTTARPAFPVIIDPNVQISGVHDTALIHEATVKFTTGLIGGDELGFVIDGIWRADYGIDGIDALYDGETGVLTLTGGLITEFSGISVQEIVGDDLVSTTGAGTVAQYKQALRAVAFRNVDYDVTQVGTLKEIEYSVNVIHPGEDRTIARDPVTGDYFEFIEAHLDWFAAENAAARSSLFGMSGYLASIHPSGEAELSAASANAIAASIITKNAWLGGSDEEKEGVWRWMTGPRTGMEFWHGGASGDTPAGAYSNWYETEPNNDHSPDGENHMEMDHHTDSGRTVEGEWNDREYDNSGVGGYIIRYGGMPGDKAMRTVSSLKLQLVDFIWSPDTPLFHEEVIFELVTATGGEPLIYAWDFGNGDLSSEQDPVHVFASPGTYEVTLTVTTPNDDTFSLMKPVEVLTNVMGHVFNDLNRDGVRNENEGGTMIPDIEVVLLRNGHIVATAPDVLAGHTYDLHSGRYSFSRISNDMYDVFVTTSGQGIPVIPDRWTLTTHQREPRETIYLSLLAIEEALGGTLKGPDFGLAPGLVVSGTVFRDDGSGSGIANDGVRNGDELGLEGFRVRAVTDSNEVVSTGLSDAMGRYVLDVIGDTTSKIDVRLVLIDDGWLPTGYTPGIDTVGKKMMNFKREIDIELNIDETAFDYTGYNFGLVPAFAVNGTQPGDVSPGGMQVYPFVVQPGTRGTVTFDVYSTRGWQYTVYRDIDGTGEIGSGQAPLSGPAEVKSGMEHFLLHVRVPTAANVSEVDVAQVTATLAYEGNESLVEEQEFQAITTVSDTRLQLTALVRNETKNIPPGEFSRTMVEAEMGDVIVYKIKYHNIDVNPATSVTMYGTIPAETRLNEDAFGLGNPVQLILHSNTDSEHPVVDYTSQGFRFDIEDIFPGQFGEFIYKVTLL